MKYTFNHIIEVSVIFSDDEFVFLTKAIKLGIPFEAEPGGFWYGLERQRKRCEDLDDNWLTINLRNLDVVILKSLEPFFMYNHPNKIERKMASDLFYNLKKIGEKAIAEKNKLNEEGPISELRSESEEA